MADFEKNHPGIAEQELWKLFLRKAEEQGLDRDFISAVGEVCAIGLNLSKYIVRFFPTFTLHDETHSANVCRWMWVLLGEQRAQLTAHEAALLLMAACCHDIGMAVSPEQEEQMRLRTYPGWDDYFRQNLKDDEEYEETKVISDRMLRNFVRMHHHERIGENLRESDWPDGVFEEELDRELLLELCRSHGTELEGAELTCRGELYDLRLCAVLLRLADLLDFDAGRTPEVLFRQMGLDRPKDAESWRSVQEHLKNRTGKFREKFVNGCIPYVAAYDNPGVEQENRKYLDWVDTELTNCRNCLSQSSRWKNLDLPYKVDDRKVKRKGYAAGKFCMTMNQDKVIDLLTGENLYSDAGVFVRELLQNSIDAVLMRAKQDTNFNLEDGLIQIDTWMDEEANTWFRIRDNGTGMNEHIIQNHFLKVGNSYYTSEEFQYANRHAPKGSYTAISRFGIGILSCFMGDKEHTQLKVSTKRFDEHGKSGIRLDVTGLHGYYFLCKEKKHPESEPWFPKMPSQDEKDRGYRTEPGTTICVNTNLLHMGEVRTIREILDKYVQFPEVRVTYNGPEGYKEYVTQQELMETVYALNPDGVVKEYLHEIPDAWTSKLQTMLPHVQWNNKPSLVLRYYPINQLSDSDNMTGVGISVELRYSVSFEGIEIANDKSIMAGDKEEYWLRFSISDFGKVSFQSNMLRQNVDGIHLMKRADQSEMSFSLHDIQTASFPMYELFTVLSSQELRVFDLVFSAFQSADSDGGLVAYNGVMTGGTEPLISESDGNTDACIVLLLRGLFIPTVDLSRERITEMTPEATCSLAMVCQRISAFQDTSLLDMRSILLMQEKNVVDILKNHPIWMEYLLREEETPAKWTIDYPVNLYDCLKMAARNQKGAPFFDFNDPAYSNRTIHYQLGCSDNRTDSFPFCMFAMPSDKGSYFGYFHRYMNLYNRLHPFSAWLVKNCEPMMDRIPEIFNTVIKTMVMEDDGKRICCVINSILNRLRSFENNRFCIHDDLFLTENDFVN